VLEMACMIKGTQLYVKKKLGSVRIFLEYFYFNYQLFKSMPEFLSSIDCTSTDLGFQISPKKFQKIQVK
jgi:hypothetical protein